VVNDAFVEKFQSQVEPLADKLTDKGVDTLKNSTTVADAAINSSTTALVENIKESYSYGGDCPIRQKKRRTRR